jgi:hypothetical protein
MIKPFYFSLVLAATTCYAAESPSFDTTWVTAKPEVLTYRTTAKAGDGLYQVSVWRTAAGIELYMNIISPGFTKSVWGAMAADFRPRESKSRIVVNDQIIMTTDCAYEQARLHISTSMTPYNRVVENTLSFSNLVVDFSQTPLLPRTLPLKPGAEFKFASLNPQSNSLVPLTIRVMGEEITHGVACYKAEGSDFEGKSAYWIEKNAPHRIMRIEQPGRATELVVSP